MTNRNLLYAGEFAIVTPVSSTLPKDGFKPAAFIPAGFFLRIFSKRPRKNPRSIPMRVSLSSLSPAHRPGFCGRIMNVNAYRVYMQCTIFERARKSPPECAQRAEIQSLWEWRRRSDHIARNCKSKSVKRLIPCRTSLAGSRSALGGDGGWARRYGKSVSPDSDPHPQARRPRKRFGPLGLFRGLQQQCAGN